MMNNYEKIYTPESLKKNRLVTFVSLPMEESLMVPTTMMLDLIKKGENVIYFSFNHDSIKVSNFFETSYKNDPKTNNIEESPVKSNYAIIDAHQIPAGAGIDWAKFIEMTIENVKKSMELNFVFLDIFPFVTQGGESVNSVVSRVENIAFLQGVTPIFIKTAGMPALMADIDIDNPKGNRELFESMSEITLNEMFFDARELVQHSDLVLGAGRVKNNFWKKVINFLLFWRKRNNFTFKTLKSRYGEHKSFRMNLDMDKFKSEIF